MKEIEPGEARYFLWGNEPSGKASTWTVKKDRSVKLLGYVDLKKVLEKKYFQECPYP